MLTNIFLFLFFIVQWLIPSQRCLTGKGRRRKKPRGDKRGLLISRNGLKWIKPMEESMYHYYQYACIINYYYYYFFFISSERSFTRQKSSSGQQQLLAWCQHKTRYYEVELVYSRYYE